jgi:hypothetical protein
MPLHIPEGLEVVPSQQRAGLASLHCAHAHLDGRRTQRHCEYCTVQWTETTSYRVIPKTEESLTSTAAGSSPQPQPPVQSSASAALKIVLTASSAGNMRRGQQQRSLRAIAMRTQSVGLSSCVACALAAYRVPPARIWGSDGRPMSSRVDDDVTSRHACATSRAARAREAARAQDARG